VVCLLLFNDADSLDPSESWVDSGGILSIDETDSDVAVGAINDADSLDPSESWVDSGGILSIDETDSDVAVGAISVVNPELHAVASNKGRASNPNRNADLQLARIKNIFLTPQLSGTNITSARGVCRCHGV
jgi:hypothetical protein